jgi:hypothetical protein
MRTISRMVRDKGIVSTEDQYKVVYRHSRSSNIRLQMTLEGQGNFKCEISRKLCEIEFVSTEDYYEIAYELS